MLKFFKGGPDNSHANTHNPCCSKLQELRKRLCQLLDNPISPMIPPHLTLVNSLSKLLFLASFSSPLSLSSLTLSPLFLNAIKINHYQPSNPSSPAPWLNFCSAAPSKRAHTLPLLVRVRTTLLCYVPTPSLWNTNNNNNNVTRRTSW